MNGKILLMRGRGIQGAVVRCQTRSHFAHAALLYPDGRTIIESYPGAGVRVKLIDSWDDVVPFDVPSMSPEQWRRAFRFAESKIGCDYDWFSILCFLTREKPPTNNKWFCSELVMASMSAAGVQLLSRIQPYKVYPGMIAYSTLLLNAN